MGRVRYIFLLVFVLMCSGASAQYYTQGRSSNSIKWMQKPLKSGKLVYPSYFEKGSQRLQMMYDSLNATINYGMTAGPLNMPVVVHTENIYSNGLVLFAPKRTELMAIPSIDNFACEWYAQLSAHEYRHTVQYANLSAHFFKPLSWFIGQQSGLISLAMVPLWYIEGDAVMAETQAASFGRALQPSFTMAYRALFDDERSQRFSHDKWFTGSLKDNVPNHYNLGYQLVRYGYQRYGVNMWDRVIDYTSRYPYTIFSKNIALKKYYNTSSDKLLDESFEQMKEFWNALPARENSAQQIVATPSRNFTQYAAPNIINDTTVYVLKTDFKKPTRLVAVDTRSGRETRLTYVGYVYTPPVRYGSRLLWTESRQSTFWEQKVSTKICYYDILRGRKGTIDVDGPNTMFPVDIDGQLAYFSYDYRGDYTLVVGEQSYPMSGVSSVHSLAYDDKTKTLAAIILEPRGMSIVSIDPRDGTREYIAEPSRASLSNLVAANGYLLFGSIASGYDEVHSIDLATGTQRRLTTSRYGSFTPSAPSAQGDVYLASYSTQGYLLSHQRMDEAKDSIVDYAYLPRNIVNLPSDKWNIANVDTLSMKINAAIDSLHQCAHTASKPYRKATHLFNIHSWMPLGFNPYDIVDESDFDFAMGVTLLSQNILGTVVGSASYRYTNKGHVGAAKLEYQQLPVKFDIEAEYGGTQMVYGLYDPDANLDLGTRYTFSSRAYLPISLPRGYFNHTITPVVEYAYSNSIGYFGQYEPLTVGFNQFGASLNFSGYSRMAQQDILPRWGYNVKATYMSGLCTPSMSELYGLSGNMYLPSFAPAHSLKLSGAMHYQKDEILSFYNKQYFPRGAEDNFTASHYYAYNLDYQLPLAYPDWGINGLVYFKRLRLGLNFDYAYFRPSLVKRWFDVWSYGATLHIDMHPLRIPVNITTFSVSVYKPSDKDGVVAGVNFSLPL